jgi:excisionase family DNA binding protein
MSLEKALLASLEPLLRSVVREELERLEHLRMQDRPRDGLMSVRALAQALDCSPSSVRRMISQGCPHVRVGESPRFNLPEVTAWMRERREPTTP